MSAVAGRVTPKRAANRWGWGGWITGGGSYGGYGAVGGTAAGGNPYGSASEFLSMGSGGGLGLGNSYPYPQIPGGSGGGLIRMYVTGTLALDGRISADGGAPSFGSLG